jgi:hypothetical protein
LLSVPRQSACHWSLTWDQSPESLCKGPAHKSMHADLFLWLVVSCPSVRFLCQASYQQVCNVQNLLIPCPLQKIEASTMRSPGQLAEVFSGTPHKANRSHDLFMLCTIAGYHPDTLHVQVDPTTALGNLVELHIVKYA